MITNKNDLIKIKKNPLLAEIKFEPICFQVLWRFAFSLPLLGEAGGKGVGSLPFGPPSPLMKSVRIFSNTHRQLDKARLNQDNLAKKADLKYSTIAKIEGDFVKKPGFN